MGGKKGNKSKKSKSTKLKSITPGMSMREKAKVRHHNFKATGVQTHGGTKKRYSKAEARKIGAAVSADNAAGGTASFASVTRGAKDPRNRAQTDQNVKAGDLVQPVKDFNTFLGNDYSMFAGPQVNYDFNKRAPSDISFSDAVRMSGARFNEAGRNDINKNIAGDYTSPNVTGYGLRPDGVTGEYKTGDIFNTGGKSGKDYRFDGKSFVPFTETAMLPGDNMGGPAAILGGVVPLTIMGANAVKNLYQNTVPKLKKKLEERYDTGEDVSSTGIGTLISSVNPVANLANLGIQSASAATLSDNELGFDRDSFNRALEGNYDPESAGGLNIGGNFGLSAEESDRLGRVFQQTPSPRMLSEGGDLRMSDMFEADTQGAKISKTINTVKNKIPILNMLPDMKINSVAEEAQRRYLGYNPNLPASALARMERKGGGGTRAPITPTVAQEVAPQYQPVPSASTTPTTQTGVDPNRLLQIQQQAYAQAYNPMLIGGFNPQFRFGTATPTIDYSTYFNY